MFGKSPGEDVPAVIVGDEIERVPVCRVKYRPD
jgi:hypothetical protein